VSDPEARSASGDEAGGPAIIGLTGPIGCGKSTVGRMLADLGGTFIDADALAREVTAPGRPELRAIRERFGGEVFDAAGTLDRSALGAVVFEDPASLADLEAIVHPGVRLLVEARLATATGDADPFVVIEAIKLVEGGLAERCDEVWLIECPASVQRGRLAERALISPIAWHCTRIGASTRAGHRITSASTSRTHSRMCLRRGSPGPCSGPWSAIRARATPRGSRGPR